MDMSVDMWAAMSVDMLTDIHIQRCRHMFECSPCRLSPRISQPNTEGFQSIMFHSISCVEASNLKKVTCSRLASSIASLPSVRADIALCSAVPFAFLCIDMRGDMCLDICAGMCGQTCAHLLALLHACRHVYRHAYGNVSVRSYLNDCTSL